MAGCALVNQLNEYVFNLALQLYHDPFILLASHCISVTPELMLETFLGQKIAERERMGKYQFAKLNIVTLTR